LVSSTPLLEGAVLRRQAAARGYLFFRGLLPAGPILDLRRRVLEVCRRFGWLAPGTPLLAGVAAARLRVGLDHPQFVPFQMEVAALAAYAALGLEPALVGVLEKVYGERALPGRGSVCRLVAPGCPDLTTPPHQDHYYIPGTDQLWTAWAPLGDCPQPLGGLAVWPGSQRRGLLVHRGEGPGRQGGCVPDDATWATADYACGDVLFFHCLTVHRACPNVSKDRLRLSVDHRYQPASHPLPGAASGARPRTALRRGRGAGP
jgi:hypothetical protein